MNLTASFVLAAVLAIVVAAEITAPAPRPATYAAPPPPAAAGKAAPADPADQTPRWIETTLARPLFSANRRPLRRPGSPTMVAASGPTLPRLAGIIMQPSGGLAIFAAAAAGQKPLAVAEGGKLDAWTVLRIGPREVRVSGPGGESTLHVAFDPAAAAAAPTPPGAASGGAYGGAQGGANLLPALRNRPINLHPNQQRQGGEAE